MTLDFTKLYCYATGKKTGAIIFKNIAKPMSLDIKSAVKPVTAITPVTVSQLFELTVFDTAENFLANSTFKTALTNDWLKVYNEFGVEIFNDNLNIDTIVENQQTAIDSALQEAKTYANNLSFTGTGEQNTASNKNTVGVGVFIQKTNVDLEFKGIASTNNKIAIVNNTTNKTIDIALNTSAISHTEFTDVGLNTHTQIDSHISDSSIHTEIDDNNLSISKTLSSQEINNRLELVGRGIGLPNVDVVTEGLGNIALFGEQTLHGFLTNGSRVAVTENTNPVENGIWITSAGVWTRADDFDNTPSIKGGTYFFVSDNDNTFAKSRFYILGDPDISVVIGTDPVNFNYAKIPDFGTTAGTATEGNDPRLPTLAQKDALAGTNGSPSALNPFVTDSDPRLSGGGDSALTTTFTPSGNISATDVQNAIQELDTEKEPVISPKNSAFNKNFGSTADTVCEGNDSRLSNNRTPTSHATSHENGGSDEILHQNLDGAGTNTHAQIDSHISDATKHRQINDGSVLTTETWSGAYIAQQLASAKAGVSIKKKVMVVSEGLGDISLSGLQTLHGYTLLHDDRVGVTSKTDPTLNGVYNARSGSWVRADDFDGSPANEVFGGVEFLVSENDNTYAGYKFYILGDADTALVVGTDPINFDFANASVTFGTTGGTATEGNDARIPSQDENDALQGTNGTPSNTNRYVTNDDARNTNARTPTSHASSHQNGGSDEIATATPANNAIPKANASGKLASGWGGSANTLATLNGSSKVVEDPANATSTPAAGKIPIADGSGKLNSWIDFGSIAVFPTYIYYAENFENPNTANWAVNNSAPASADTVNNALIHRRFDQTTEWGVGFMFVVPSGAVNMTITLKSRAQTAPAGARTVGNKLYYRQIPDNGAISSWSSHVLNDVDIPTNANWQYDTQTFALADPTVDLVAGNLYQFEFTRVTPVAGTNLTGDWNLLELSISFS